MNTKQQRMMPHHEHGRFWNYKGETQKRVILPSCMMYFKKLWMTQGYDQSHLSAWQSFDTNLTTNSVPSPDDLSYQPPLSSITWIGHASFLIKVGAYTILTDPLFHNLTPLFPRLQQPGMTLPTVPQIHIVLISHNHWDHLEKSTIIYLAKKYNPLFLVPRGDKSILQRWGITNINEHMWWETSSYNIENASAPLSLTFLPAHHWSGRSIFDTNRSLWGSWMITQGPYNCYFAGDTAYGAHFQEIAQEFPSIHTALMPIGPCEPYNYLRQSHMNAEDAGKAFLSLNAQHFIPMHWGTFGFGIDRPLEPLHRLQRWWEQTIKQPATNRQLIPLRIGQQFSSTDSYFANTTNTELSSLELVR
jgi:L-ascorbate metabolism protein UlaG (beta-lactamase superfamily)